MQECDQGVSVGKLHAPLTDYHGACIATPYVMASTHHADLIVNYDMPNDMDGYLKRLV